MEFIWPEDYRYLEEDIYKKWNIKSIDLRNELSSGKSGAKVFFVDIQMNKYNGIAVLKFNFPWYKVHKKYEQGEHHKYELALKTNESFALEHLPEIIDTYEDEKAVVFLTKLAGNMESRVLPLCNIKNSVQLKEISRQVFSEILSKWNQDSVFLKVSNNSSIMRQCLDYRIIGENNIFKLLKNDFHIDPNSEAFYYKSKLYPNPLFYANNWAGCEERKFAFGISHGDLHGNNILIKLSGEKFEYYIIDLAFYNTEGLLFFDNAYFEISYLLEKLSAYHIDLWIQYVESISCFLADEIDYTKFEEKDEGIANIIRLLRSSQEGWILEYYGGRQEDLLKQAILARVIAGLNYAYKNGLDIEARIKALFYAALNLNNLLDIEGNNSLKTKQVVIFEEELDMKVSNCWRDVANIADNFNGDGTKYVLISGKSKSDEKNLQTVGDIPWSLVFDFDKKSCIDGLYKKISKKIESKGIPFYKWHYKTDIDVNIEKAQIWFMTQGEEGEEDTLCTKTFEWRQKYPKPIRNLLNKLYNVFPSENIVVIINAENISTDSLTYLKQVLAYIEEYFSENVKFILIGNSYTADVLEVNASSFTNVICTFEELAIGIRSIFYKLDEQKQVKVPSENGIKPLNEKTVSEVSEDFTIVHEWIKNEYNSERMIGYDFYRGYEINWKEISDRFDVERDITERLKQEIISNLKSGTVEIIELYYMPGAGATTVSKRIGWDIRNLFPVLMMENFSSNSVDKIKELYKEVHMPIFVIAEAATISNQELYQFQQSLRGTDVRSTILYLIRDPQANNIDFFLRNPMENDEPSRFYDIYVDFTKELPDGQERATKLYELTYSPEQYEYRSPFFYGLYTFEKNLVSIPSYIKGCIKPLSSHALRVLQYLSLLTRFGQKNEYSKVTINEIKRIIGSGNGTFDVKTFFGSAYSLLKKEGDGYLVVHPIIAEQILIHSLSKNDEHKNSIHWHINLKKLCIHFIESFVAISYETPDITMKKFHQLFISRNSIETDTNSNNKELFSEIILTIPNEYERLEIFDKLTEKCPRNSHFWKHKGRYFIYYQKNYNEAEKCLFEAIKTENELKKDSNDLDNNSSHYHTLGLVYRRKINYKFENAKLQRNSLEQVINDIKVDFKNAEEAFESSRKLNGENIYSYISYIQLVIEVTTNSYEISSYKSYSEFLNDTTTESEWIRSKINLASDLLNRIKFLQTNQRKKEDGIQFSYMTKKCETQLTSILSSNSDMIKTLKAIQTRRNIDDNEARSFVVNTFYIDKKSWKDIDDQQIELIRQLMDQNILNGSDKYTDLMYWFESYRRSSTCNISTATSRLDNHNSINEKLDLNFYLYILYFVSWYEELSDNYEKVEFYIDKCSETPINRQRYNRYSNEWLVKKGISTGLRVKNFLELGEWNSFYNKSRNIFEPVEGKIAQYINDRAGYISIRGRFKVFFVPGRDNILRTDINKRVRFFLGFSYEGLRAWEVKIIEY